MAGIVDITRSELQEAKRSFIFVETSRCLAFQSKFYRACSVLRDNTQGDRNTNIEVKLLMVECYVRLGRELRSEKAMESIREELLAFPTESIQLVNTFADGYKCVDSCCVREIFIRKLLSEMYLCSDMTPSEKFEGARKCVNEIELVSSRIFKKAKGKTPFAEGNTTEDMSDDTRGGGELEVDDRLKVIALDFGARYMIEIMDSLRRMDGMESGKTAHSLAKCANTISNFYCKIQDHKRSIVIMKKGIEIMDREFGVSAANYQIYRDLFDGIGVCLYNLDCYKEAEKYYVKAIDFGHQALDYANEEMRKRDLEKSESDLRNTRMHL